MIQLKNVSKKFLIPHEKRNTLKDFFLNIFRPLRYETFYALKDISLDIPPGEWVGIVGPNGSGKSTLLRLTAQIFLPDSGQVLSCGQTVPLLELGIGFHGELTAQQNIILNGTLLGISPEKLRRKQQEILKFADVEKFRDTKLKNFSSGMVSRLAFAIALQCEGDIFLLDEVFSVGDLDFQKKCVKAFSLLRQKQKTVILVSHNLSHIKQWCDRVIWLENGKIVDTGKPEKILHKYEKK